MTAKSLPSFDLPINEVKGYITDLMGQIGEEAVIDGIPSKIMLAELERVYNNLQQNMKRVVFLYETNVNRGSKLTFDGKTTIVYNVPNDDIVSKSAEVLIFNSKPTFERKTDTYVTDPNSPNYGDIISNNNLQTLEFDGFIERINAKEKQFDVGLLHDAILRFITFEGSDIELDDIVTYKDKKYRVIDVDDITEGILVVQLANVRTI